MNMKTSLGKSKRRARRQKRVRASIRGTKERPRLNVFRSLRGIYAQIIDDTEAKTLVSASTKNYVKKDGDAGGRTGKTAESYLLGLALAEKAKMKGIKIVVFDRAGYRYHGRIRAVAEGARFGGLEF